MRKTNHFLTFIIILIIVTSCQFSSPKQIIETSATTDISFNLKKKINQGYIWGLNINIKGTFSDTTTFSKSAGNNEYIYELFGSVDTTFRGDWYSDTCLIKFKNIKHPINNLKIEYEFYD